MFYIFSSEPAFEDITISLLTSIRDKGINIKRLKEIKNSNALVIMLGLNNYEGLMPKNYIVYQLEQSKPLNEVNENNTWFTNRYLKRLEGSIEIWDYSMQNIVNIRNLFSSRNLILPVVKYVPITYLRNFLGTDTNKDIDVLFYGSTNPRREKIMADLEAINLKIHFAGYNLWNERRQELINRSKIILNIHFYDNPILETTRLAPLVSQGAFVISEPSSDKILDKFWSSMVTFCSYDKIVDKISSFLQVWESCKEFAILARQELSKHQYLDKLNLDHLEKYMKEDAEALTDENNFHNLQLQNKIKKATCKRENIEDGGTAEVLELVKISDQNLPSVTIVTPTYNRSELLPIALRNFRKTIYPDGKLEWIVFDDSNETHRAKNKELLQGDIRIKYLESNQKISISEKRNYLAYNSKSEYIVHMDDDDYYYPESVLARIKLLIKYKDQGIRCVGCTEIGIYHLFDNYSYLMSCGNYVSEASMAYHRSFWEDRPFPSDKEMSKMSSKTGEGSLFVESRLNEIIDMPFIFNFIAITHKKNITGRLRTYNLDKEAKMNGTNFFNLWDIDTQLFFIKISRNCRKML